MLTAPLAAQVDGASFHRIAELQQARDMLTRPEASANTDPLPDPAHVVPRVRGASTLLLRHSDPGNALVVRRDVHLEACLALRRTAVDEATILIPTAQVDDERFTLVHQPLTVAACPVADRLATFRFHATPSLFDPARVDAVRDDLARLVGELLDAVARPLQFSKRQDAVRDEGFEPRREDLHLLDRAVAQVLELSEERIQVRLFELPLPRPSLDLRLHRVEHLFPGFVHGDGFSERRRDREGGHGNRESTCRVPVDREPETPDLPDALLDERLLATRRELGGQPFEQCVALLDVGRERLIGSGACGRVRETELGDEVDDGVVPVVGLVLDLGPQERPLLEARERRRLPPGGRVASREARAGGPGSCCVSLDLDDAYPVVLLVHLVLLRSCVVGVPRACSREGWWLSVPVPVRPS